MTGPPRASTTITLSPLFSPLFSPRTTRQTAHVSSDVFDDDVDGVRSSPGLFGGWLASRP
jgi:hypothetical protein